MRDHATIFATFWTRGTGKALRGHPRAQVLAMYVMSCGHSSMVGIYPIGLPTLMYETGLSEDDLRWALAKCAELDFCFYDEADDLLWVPNLAHYQVGAEIKEKDKRRAGVIRALKPFVGHRFYDEFVALYGQPYRLFEEETEAERPSRQGSRKPLSVSSNTPSKGLRAAPESLPRDYVPDPALAPVPDPVPDQGAQGETAEPGRKPTDSLVPLLTASNVVAAESRALGLPFGHKPIPERLEITEAIRANCVFAGAPEPKPEHVVAFLADRRRKALTCVDYDADFTGWMVRQKKFDASEKARGERFAPPSAQAASSAAYKRLPPRPAPPVDPPEPDAVAPPPRAAGGRS